MTIDDDGLVLDVTDRNGNKTEFVYDGAPQNGDRRNLLQVKVPKGESTLDGFRVVTFTYDNFDNVLSVQDDLGNEIVTTYDNIDRPLTVQDALTRVMSYAYEDLLLKETLIPANNGSGGNSRKVSLTYDTASRLSEIHRDIDALGTQQLGAKYVYTGFSQLATLERMKNGVSSAFTFAYDQAGRGVSSTARRSCYAVSLQRTGTTAYEPFCLGNAGTSARGVRRKVNLEPRCLVSQLEVGTIDPSDPLELLNVRETRTWEHDELGRMTKSSKGSSAKYHFGTFGFDSYGEGNLERTYLYDELASRRCYL